MSCASPSTLFRLTLLILTFIVSCTFVASVVWLLRTKTLASRYENYYLSRINITAKVEDNSTTAESDHYKDLIKIEIAMRRVEENSRRVKEYTKSLLWDNKDKSLWCVLFKDSARGTERGSMPRLAKHKNSLDEDYIRSLREQKMREAIIHLRHHGAHHRRRLEIPDYIK